MAILLYHEGENATITTPARLGRESHEPRHYRAEGHFLLLDGPGHIVSHDAEEICKIPGWRLATPQEQNAYHARKQRDDALAEEAAIPEDAQTATSDIDNEMPEQVENPQQDSTTTAPTRGAKRRK